MMFFTFFKLLNLIAPVLVLTRVLLVSRIKATLALILSKPEK